MVLSPKILFTSSDSLYILCPHTQKPLWANMYWRQKFFKVWFHLKQLVYTVATHTHTHTHTYFLLVNRVLCSFRNNLSSNWCINFEPYPTFYQAPLWSGLLLGRLPWRLPHCRHWPRTETTGFLMWTWSFWLKSYLILWLFNASLNFFNFNALEGL